MKDDHELGGVDPERRGGGLHPRHVSVVVSSPNLDHPVELTHLEAAQQVTEVGREVRRLAVRTDHHAILFFHQLFLHGLAIELLQGWAKPQRAIALLEVAPFPQALDGPLRKPGLPDRVLPEPLVVMDVQPRDRGLDLFHDLLHRVHAELRLRLRLGQLLDARQVVARHLGDLGHVRARVPTLRGLGAVEPRVDRKAELPRLRVVGVDVVLTLDLVVRELEQPADRVAEDRAAAVSDVKGTGRVDARELDLQPLATPDVHRPVARSHGCHALDQLLQPRGGQPEVDVTPDNFNRRRLVGDHDLPGDPVRDLLWRLLEHARKLHPGRARILAPLHRLGAPELEIGQVAVRSHRAGRSRRLPQGFGDLLPDAGRGHLAHVQVGCWPDSVSWAWLEDPPREYVTVTFWLG